MTVDWGVVLLVLVKLGIAAVLGAVIGVEREMHGRPAGVRTHMMLIIGVTLFSEVSKSFGGGDPGRIAAQIVTGVGFLGAGTILRMGAEIKGLTSAASLWAISAIGMAVSVGGSFIAIAVAATVLSVFTLAIVDNIERKAMPNAHPRSLTVKLRQREDLSVVIESIEAAGGIVKGLRLVPGDDGLHVQMDVQGIHGKILAAASRCPHVEESVWSD
ncbi:MAG: MgtC/SapB family protein [Armatimonadetes bacterium]|nr:MgtC/SapB family protein [Armatimonadota bacterium]